MTRFFTHSAAAFAAFLIASVSFHAIVTVSPASAQDALHAGSPIIAAPLAA